MKVSSGAARLFPLLLCVACSGRSERSAFGGDGTSGDAGSAVGGAAGNGRGGSTSENGGTGGDEVLGLAGAADSDAGEPGYTPMIGSGTRSCPDADYCFGLSCYAPLDFQPTICVAPCKSDAECAPHEACIGTQKLARTCYSRCGSPSDCEFHFDCLDVTGASDFVCFPATWGSRLQEL